jgi:hypothetical protein
MMRTPRATAALAALLLAGAVGGLGLAPAGAATAGCRSVTGAQPPTPGTDGMLQAVVVLSPCDAWGVGAFHQDGILQTLAEHWDGANWTVVPSPDPGTRNNILTSVRAASPTSIWAVGGFSDGSGEQNLILHWDGKCWTQQDAPSPGPIANQLAGVRAVSGSEAWAVGISVGSVTQKALILHLTGGRWRQVSAPKADTNQLLSGVAATSATDVWAVGASGSTILEATRGAARRIPPAPRVAASESTLILHWNGRKWTAVPSPSPGGPGARDELAGVNVSSARNAWAVGTSFTASGTRPLILRWNGTRWSIAATPAPGGGAGLNGVGASSDSSAWAVGLMQGPSGPQALALHCC